MFSVSKCTEPQLQLLTSYFSSTDGEEEDLEDDVDEEEEEGEYEEDEEEEEEEELSKGSLRNIVELVVCCVRYLDMCLTPSFLSAHFLTLSSLIS